MRLSRGRYGFRTLACAFIVTFLTPNAGLAQGEKAPDEGDVEEVPADPAPPPSEASPSDQPKPSEPKAPDAPAAPPPASEAEPTEEEMKDAELADEMEGEDVTRKAPKGKGVIWGLVTDTKFEEPIIEAPVQVVGHKYKTVTDIEGRFRLELPPGTYAVRVFYELHQPARIDRITVTEGKVQRVDFNLVPDENAVEEVVVEEQADKTSAEGQTLERRRSASVGDGVGRAEIARTPDRNAAEAAQRVVGATIVGSRFVYVRGLGERYTNALLNGTPLPSPEPDRQTVPLDLFPSLVLDSITITKTFTPDMPADFAGGSVRIHTREFPRQTLFQVSLNGGYNTETTFRERPTYQGSNTDWLGYDGGLRQLPEGIPNQKLDDPAELEQWGPKINARMSTKREMAPPNHGLSVVAGDSFKVGKEQKLGLVGAINYGHSYNFVHQRTRTFRAETGGRRIETSDIKYEGGIDTVRWGAFASASYELSDDHKLNLTGLHSQSADDEATEAELVDPSEASGTITHHTHLQFTSRALDFGQLRGFHRLGFLNRAEIDWHLALAHANREEPDTRHNEYTRALDGSQYQWSPGPTSGSHFFSTQGEQTVGGGLDLTQPLTKTPEDLKLKVGGLVSSRERDFSARRFNIGGGGRAIQDLTICEGGTWDPSCPDKLFVPANFGRGMLTLAENTQANDAYEATLQVYAGYGMLDAQVLKNVRAIGGARVELTQQDFVGFSPFEREGTELKSAIDQTDILPAFSLVFAGTTKTNTRLAVSRTLARPQLREIAPFLSAPYAGQLPIQGNKDLKLTKITNADLRFEFFPTLREVMAFSFFYKHFEKPIEEVINPGFGIISYRNAKSAELIGVELEARKNLEFLAPALKDFALITNLTLARSRVQFESAGLATNASRPLSYQSPYIVNISLDYGNDASGTDVRLLYNVHGRRLTTVGLGGLDDIYEQPRGLLDLTVAQKLAKHFELKLTAQNLLSSDVVYSQGETVESGNQNVTKTFSNGSTFTVTGTYTY